MPWPTASSVSGQGPQAERGEAGKPMPQSLSLDALLSGQVFALVLIFARLGSAFMLLPGFGDTQVSPRIRLLLALALAFVLLPVLKPLLPALPRNAAGLFVLMALETFIGVFLGTVTRMLTASLEIAGQFLSQVVG